MKRKAEFDIDESYLKTGEPTKKREDPSPKKEEEPKSKSQFAGLFAAGLFKDTPKADESKGLFGNMFSNTQNTEQKPLFDFKPAQGNLFGNLTQNKQESSTETTEKKALFDFQPAQGNLFGNLTQNKQETQNNFSLFSNINNQNSFLNQPPKTSFLDQKNTDQNQSNEDEDNDPELEEGQKTPEIDKTQSKGNYKYEEGNEKTISKSVVKFKVSDKTFELGEVSIESKKEDQSLKFLVYRNSMKNIMYQGLIFKKASNYQNLNKRSDCLQVVTFLKKQESSGEKLLDKYNKDICKLMFNNETDCNDLIEKLKEVCN